MVSRFHRRDGLHAVSTVQAPVHKPGFATREAQFHSVKLFGRDRRERRSGAAPSGTKWFWYFIGFASPS
jgi:hypothetical protein